MIFPLNITLLKKLNKEMYNEEDIINYIDSLIAFLELNNYYHKTLIYDTNNSNLGVYSFDTRDIKLYIREIKKAINESYQLIDFKCNQILFYNLSILEVIFHEITHIFEAYIAFESDFNIAPLYKLDISKINDDESQYSKYHDYFMFERDANVTSLENIIYYIKRYINNHNLLDMELKRLYEYLLIGYEINKDKIISPSDVIFRDIYKEEVPEISNISLFDRLRFGYKITKEEYKTVIKNKNNILLCKNIIS